MDSEWDSRKAVSNLRQQARDPGILSLTVIHLLEAGTVILLFAIFNWLDWAKAFQPPTFLFLFIVIFVLGAQANTEMRVSRRIDALITLLSRQRLLDDAIAENDRNRGF